MVTAWFVDERRIIRRRAVWITAMLAFLLGIPSALSSGMVPWLGRLPFVHMDFFSLMGLIFGTISLAVGALLISLFFGWVWKMDNAAAEIASGCSWFGRWKGLFGVMLKFVCPACILVLLLFLLFGGD